MAAPFKSGFIAIVGPPNVGKSTLINSLVGEKVSIVTPKPQTTRHRILGIRNLPQAQLIFVDTPGIHETQKTFNLHLVKIAQTAYRESDVVLVMVEATEIQPTAAFLYLRRGLYVVKKPVLLVINKIDLVEKAILLPMIDKYHSLYSFQEIVPLSALTKSGLDRLELALVTYLPEGPHYFPEDMYTDQPARVLVAEIIREKIFLLLHQEIPYSISVAVEEFSARESGILFIRASVWVEKPSQKKILIGREGRMLKQIGRSAREEIERLLQNRVYLELWVTVKRNWTLREIAVRESLEPH